MDDKTLNSLKLAGLRAGEITLAAAQDSALVRTAIKFNLWRKKTKSSLKRIFRRVRPYAVSNSKLRFLVHIRGGIGDVCHGAYPRQKITRSITPSRDFFYT